MPTLLEIVSPDRLLLSQPVDMAVIPAAEGEMGVLPGHSPMIVLLQGGTITIHEGFAEVTPERCTVLADEAIPVAEVSRAQAETRLQEAQAEVAAAGTDVAAYDLAAAKVQSARAMLAAAGAA